MSHSQAQVQFPCPAQPRAGLTRALCDNVPPVGCSQVPVHSRFPVLAAGSALRSFHPNSAHSPARSANPLPPVFPQLGGYQAPSRFFMSLTTILLGMRLLKVASGPEPTGVFVQVSG
jgi:hypothetical protein